MKCKGDGEVACMIDAVMCLRLIGCTPWPWRLLTTISAKRMLHCRQDRRGRG
jgi:hypothetical protein